MLLALMTRELQLVFAPLAYRIDKAARSRCSARTLSPELALASWRMCLKLHQGAIQKPEALRNKLDRQRERQRAAAEAEGRVFRRNGIARSLLVRVRPVVQA